MQIVYIPSESMSVQGKKDEIYKRYGKDWNINNLHNSSSFILCKKTRNLNLSFIFF